MDLLALILACSIHPDDELLRVLIDVQSGGNVYFVGDLSTLKTNDSLTTAADALRAAERILRHGGRPAVGLLGVPLEWAARFGRTPSELFDACTNIAVGSAALADYLARCSGDASSNGHGRRHKHKRSAGSRVAMERSRACVLGKLSDDLGVRSVPSEILNAIAQRRGASPVGQDSPSVSSPIFPEGTDLKH